jgi:arginase
VTVALIRVPYDAGQRERRLGAGPDALVAAGAADRLATASGASVVPARLASDAAFPLEVGVGFELARKLAGEVAQARRNPRHAGGGAFPVVLAGNCLSAVGTISGLGDVPRLGAVWLDAHGDLNTPETSPSGLLDGMALAVATGRCWGRLAAEIPGFRPLSDGRVLHLGARDLDPEETALLTTGAIDAVGGQAWTGDDGPAAVAVALDRLATRVDAVYLHVDLDVHDAGQVRTSPHGVPGGPGPSAVAEAVAATFARMPVVALGVTCYAPEVDTDGSGRAAALNVLETAGRALADRLR